MRALARGRDGVKSGCEAAAATDGAREPPTTTTNPINPIPNNI
jgi:hypothetical protein